MPHMNKIKITHSIEAPEGWDNYLACTGSKNDLLQSKYWSDINVGLGRGEPIFLRVKNNDVLMGQMLIFQQCISVRNKFLKALMVKLGYKFYRIDMADCACVSNWEDQFDAFNAIFVWIKAHAKSKKIYWIRAQGSPATNISATQNLLLMRKHGFSLKKWGTYQVDLGQSENDLLYSFDHSARKGIGKSVRLGIQVIKISTWSEFFEDFLIPYINWSNKKDIAQHLIEEGKLVWGHPLHSDYYSYYVAKNSDNVVLAVLGTYTFGGVSTEIFSANSPEAMKSKIPAQDHLHWAAMLASKSEGAQIFDLAGVAPESENVKEQSIKRFKKKWGGQYLEYGIHEWVHPLLKLIQFIRRGRN